MTSARYVSLSKWHSAKTDQVNASHHYSTHSWFISAVQRQAATRRSRAEKQKSHWPPPSAPLHLCLAVRAHTRQLPCTAGKLNMILSHIPKMNGFWHELWHFPELKEVPSQMGMQREVSVLRQPWCHAEELQGEEDEELPRGQTLLSTVPSPWQGDNQIILKHALTALLLKLKRIIKAVLTTLRHLLLQEQHLRPPSSSTPIWGSWDTLGRWQHILSYSCEGQTLTSLAFPTSLLQPHTLHFSHSFFGTVQDSWARLPCRHLQA